MIKKLIALGLATNVVLATPQITGVYITSSVDGGQATTENKTISFDSDARLHAVLEVENNGSTFYITDANRLQIDNEEIDTSLIVSPNEFQDISLNWFRVESNSEGTYYSNTNPTWHWDHLEYLETPISQNNWSLEANVFPTISEPTILDGIAVGTMRYKLTAENGTATHSTPGIESRYKGGVSEEVHRISRKGNRNNPIVDNTFSLCNNPFIWGSASWTGSRYDNQSERFIGSDCADLCVAGARLAGHSELPYSGSRELSNSYSRQIAKPESINSQGIYFQRNGNPIEINDDNVRIGDFIYWRGHVGVLSKDNYPFGILNDQDEVLHTLFNQPGEEPIKDIYPGRAFKVVRPKVIK